MSVRSYAKVSSALIDFVFLVGLYLAVIYIPLLSGNKSGPLYEMLYYFILGNFFRSAPR